MLKPHAWMVVLGMMVVVPAAQAQDFSDMGGAQAPAPAAAPAWISQAARTVDNGYIVYVTVGESADLAKASYNSEAAGDVDVANECSFVPKGVRVEDRYQEDKDGKTVVYTKTGIAFNDCEVAQNATDVAEIKRLANPRAEQMVAKYESDMGKADAVPPPVLASAPPEAAPGGDAGAAPGGDPNATAAAGGVAGAAGAVASSDAAPAPADPNVLETPEQFFLARQEAAALKRRVILATPGAYEPGAPETTNFVNTVTPLVERVRGYAMTHPGVRTWGYAFSTFRARRHFFRNAGLVRAERIESHFSPSVTKPAEPPTEVRGEVRGRGGRGKHGGKHGGGRHGGKRGRRH